MIRVKVDENLHPDVAGVLRAAGHDALTIWDQQMRGTPDVRVAAVCRAEQRALLSLDVDFADIRTYPPDEYAGIVVLRPRRQDRGYVTNLVRTLLPLFETEPLVGRLWIVDETGVRVRGGTD